MGNKLEKAADNITDKKSQEWVDQSYSPSMLQTYSNMNETQIREFIKMFGAHAISHKEAKMNGKEFNLLMSASRSSFSAEFGNKALRDIPGALLTRLESKSTVFINLIQ